MNRTVSFDANSGVDNPAKKTAAPARVRLRTVALPNEHGGWSLTLEGGWPLAASLGLWAVLAGRVVPSILYVRARLRRLHGETPSALPTVVAHVAALALVALLAWAGVAPPLAPAAFVILLLRAVAGLSAGGVGGSAKQVGISEIFYGVITVLAVAAGHLF